MPLDLKLVVDYVGENIGKFHSARLAGLRELELREILRRKNPYLFKAKNVVDAHDLVKVLLDAHLSSQEETMFGEFLEELAIYICGQYIEDENHRRKELIWSLKGKELFMLSQLSQAPIGGTKINLPK